MRLRDLDVRRLPGIAASFHVQGLTPGINVVVGPNASGKSSLVRVVRATLWPSEGGGEGADVVTWWVRADAALRAALNGGVTWQIDGRDCDAPTAPGPSGCRILQLAALLGPSVDDRALVERVRVQMAGGYDLPEVRGRWVSAARHGRREAKGLEEARQELRRVAADQRRLADEVDSLEALRLEAGAAQEATRNVEPVKAAQARRAVARDKAAVDARLAELPEALPGLTGDEPERYRQALADGEAAQAEVDRLAKQGRDARALADEACPPGSPTEAEARSWLDRARAIRDLERAWEEAREERARLPDPAGEVASPQVLDELEELAGEAWEVAERLRGVRNSLRGIPEGTGDPRRLAQAGEHLRGWLASDGAAAAPPPGVSRTAGLLLLLAGAALAWVERVAGAAVMGLGVGLLIASLRRTTAPAGARQWRRSFDDTGVAPPARWSRSSVAERLREIEDAERDARRAAEGPALRAEADELQARADALEDRRRALGSALGLDASWLALSDLADALRTRREADARRAEATALEIHRRSQLDESRQAVRAWLEAVDGAGRGNEGQEATHVDGVLEGLRTAAKARERSADADQERLAREADVRRFAERADAIVRRAGLDVDGADLEGRLVERVRRRAEYEEARVEARALQARLDQGEEPAALAALSDAALEEKRLALLAEAEGFAPLLKGISEIEAALKQAGTERALQAALAAERTATDTLWAARQAHLHTLTGAFLLDDATSAHGHSALPSVARRASELFARFTRNAFTLRLDPQAATGGLGAVDTASGEGLPLAALSDGTRMQLLLAARVAFAVESEGDDGPLPLILDEALTAADPGRFRAVADALVDIAEDGRQVIYLTSDGADVARWRDACDARGVDAKVVDLAEVRRVQGAMRAEDLASTPRTPTPPPGDHTDAEYGALLGVPAPDPWRPGGLHLFHLLRHDLKLLHRVLTDGRVAHVGAWRTLGELGGADSVVGTATRASLDARCAAWTALARAWRVGRGQGATRRTLEASGAVSGAFIDRLAEVLEEVDGDAARLVDIIEGGRDGRTKGFRTQKLSDLRDHFCDTGHLDPRPVHAEEALRAAVLGDPDTHLEPSEAHGLLDSLLPTLPA